MRYYQFKESDAELFQRYVNANARKYGNELQFQYCPYCHGGRHRDAKTFSINLTTGQFECKRSSCGAHGNMITLAKDFDFSLGAEYDRYYNQETFKFRKFGKKKIQTTGSAIDYLKKRGISQEITERYKITTQKENTNILVFPFFDENGIMVSIKYRKADFNPEKDKNKEWFEPGCMPALFGMEQCEDFETLIITEGQIDSLSIAESGIKNAVSVPNGARGFTWVPHCWDWFLKFKRLIVFGDRENGKITLLNELETRNDVSNNLADNYYNKTQADAKLELVSDALRVTLNEEYTTKEDAIKSTVEQFYLSTSPTTLSGGSWSTTQPTWTQGKYIWRRTLVTKADGTTSYTPSSTGVCITGNTGATGTAGATGVGITSVDVQYYLSSSSTALSGGSWSATAPTWVNGKYMWSKTVTTLSNGTTKESTPVCITGAKGATGATGATGAAGAAGATGTGIASITEEYYLSTSKTAQSGGSWTTTPPTWSNGKYIWTRSKIVYKNPTSTAYTTPVCDSSWEAANGAAKVATNYMDFTTSGGLQIGNKTSGSWSGFRTQITSSAFNILNAAGAVLASYGASLIELGKNSINAIIKLCGGKGQISYDSSDGYLKVSSDKIQLLGSGDSSIITNQTISGTKYETRVCAGGVVYREEIGNVPVAGIESTIGEGDNAKAAWIEVDPYEIVFEGGSHTILNTPIIDIRGSTTIQNTLEVYKNAYFSDAAQIGYTRISDGVLGFYHGSTDARNNTNRVGYIGSPSVSNLDIYINNEAGGWVYVNSIFRCLSNIRVAGNLILEASKSTGTSMSWYWADGALHDIVSKASDGLKCYIGPGSISSSYKTVTYVRGYTLRLYNHGGGTYLGSSGSTAVTSDRNLKRDIYDINDQYVEFFMRLRPVSYKYNAKENVGHRDHIGYIAQEVEDALLDSGLTTEQFGGICIETDVDFNMDYDSEMTEEELAAGNIHYDKLYSLRYEEFIALNTHMIQKALNVIDEQQMKINELETRIAKLEKILEKQVSG